jgi:hypothetical protein
MCKTKFWKKPRFWLVLVAASFVLNLLVAILTIHNYILSSSSSSLPQSFSTGGVGNGELFFSSLKSTGSTSSFSSLRAGWQESKITQSQFWHRMLQETATCNGRLSNVTTTNNSITNDTFLGSIRSFIISDNGRSESSNKNNNLCVPPSSDVSFCKESRYTVVIYSRRGTTYDGNAQMRSLVTQVMAFVAYPSVEKINLILYGEEDGLVASDSKYARRIASWKDSGTVKVVQQTSLWDAMDHLEVPTHGMLWIDGDNPKDWNGTMFKARLQLWKEIPSMLVVGRYLVQLIDNNGRCPAVPSLHGMMMHQNYLCLLKHPVVSRLRTLTESIYWDMATIAISLLLVYMGDGYYVDATNAVSVTERQTDATTMDMNHSRRSLDSTNLEELIIGYFGCPCSAATSRLPLTVRCS